MKTDTFVARTRIPAPAGEVYDWHCRPGALERLIPPWESVEAVTTPVRIENGSQAVLRVRIGPLRLRWVAEHRDVEPGRQFRDVQVHGPFSLWEHTHRIVPDGPEACHMEDRIRYALPMGRLGRAIAGSSVRSKLDRLFRYRHAVLKEDMMRAGKGSDVGSLTVLVTGSSGLVGSALTPWLTASGHRVVRLLRPASSSGNGVRWDPDRGVLDPRALDGIDAVVHLAGENIATGRWSSGRMRRIRESRIAGTRLLARSLAECENPPRVLVSASAVGFYGSRGDTVLDESSPPGSGFLASVCRDWEEATAPALGAGIRVILLRFGVILSPRGGALKAMLPAFRAGLGGKIGSGRQYLSWLSLEDAVGIVGHAVEKENLHGPVNAVSPDAVPQAEFARNLGSVLSRPAVCPMPAPMARAVFGKLADELLLASTRVRPTRLLDTGYRFRQESLDGALRHLLGR